MSSSRSVSTSRRSHTIQTSRPKSSVFTQSVRPRLLRFDVLESRRLLAGLNVLVYTDSDGSRDQNQSVESGLSQQVVYVDINKNGQHDRNEPISITDQSGIASFTGLPSGRFEVKLLGSNSNLIQTTPVRPAASSSLIADFALDEVISSLDGSEFIGRSGNQLRRFSASGSIGESVEIPGSLVDTAFGTNDGWILVESDSSRRELFRWLDGELIKSPVDAENWLQVESFGDSVVAWDAEYGLVRLSGANTGSPGVIEISKGGVFESIHALGNDRVVIEEQLENGFRLSVHRIDGDQANLEAERTFADQIVSWTVSPKGDAIYVDTGAGIHIVDTVNGLNSRYFLASSESPIFFDPIASILYTGDSGQSGLLRAWDPRIGKELSSFDLGSDLQSLAGIALSSDGRVIVSSGDEGVSVRSLMEAVPTEIEIFAGQTHSISIGVQRETARRNLAFPLLPRTLDVMEDGETETSWDSILGSIPLSTYVVVLQPPERGELSWSVEAGSVYRPFADVEGSDRFVVALFDGYNWSLPQRIQIHISGQNDPPTAIRLPYRLEVRENDAGAKVGPVSVDDVDASASYNWYVDDQRFEVRDGVLRLKEGIVISTADSDRVILTIRAEEIPRSSTDSNESHSISATATISVTPNPLPSEFFVSSEYSVPEGHSGASLGYVYVRGMASPDTYSISVSDPRFEVVSGLFKLKDGVSLEWETDDAIPVTLFAQASTGEQFSKNTIIRVIQDRTPTIDPHDVDGDGFITPIDVLILINQINSSGSGPVPQEGEGGRRIDIDGDGHISPIDVLILINVINNQQENESIIIPSTDRYSSLMGGEGEAPLNGEFRFVDDIAPDVRSRRRGI